ncbi:MAG: hypothetical protein HOP16_13965 [Acidobacteria bacterium]|nr:hypothetical protein [Acidobacteriota bacterium]
MLTLLVFVDVHFIYDVVPRGRRLKLALALGTLGLLAPVTSVMVTAVRGSDRPSELVLLGLDSVAQTDDVGSLREFVATRGGAWYQRAVAPGLLTNAVWASVMTMKPVREHGVFQTFQPFPRNQAKLLQSARAAGFYTVSVFSDQITCAIGSQAGFDEDRSGPIGWRQMMLTAVQNSSVFLPLFRPILSGAPWSAAPVNHAGTYTYDLTREVREILTSGVPGRKTFVAAHLTYLHLAAYPRAFDLSGHELWRMAQARAGSLRDRSFYWQDSDLPTDPVPLHRWKLARLQRVIRETVESTGFLDGGRLLIFSDHGERTGLTPETIGDPRFHHVLLASFGLPVANVDQPRSLADIGSLLGLSPPQASDPVVEFINPPPELWPSLTASARPRWSGQVDVDPVLLGLVFKSLKSHRPWASHSKGEAPTGESHDARPHE